MYQTWVPSRNGCRGHIDFFICRILGGFCLGTCVVHVSMQERSCCCTMYLLCSCSFGRALYFVLHRCTYTCTFLRLFVNSCRKSSLGMLVSIIS